MAPINDHLRVIRRIQALTASPCRSVGGRDALKGFVWMHALVVILTVGFREGLRRESLPHFEETGTKEVLLVLSTMPGVSRS